MAFFESTRQNIRRGGRVDYVNGGSTPVTLPAVGYLAKIHVLVTGVMTVAPGTGTATLGERAPWNLLRRVRYQLGSGTELYNVSGWGAYLVDLHSKLEYIPENGKISSPYTAKIYQALAASGANTWNFGFTIPITPNDRDLTGMILLQAQGTVTQLLLEWQAGGGATQEFPVVLTGNATATFVGRADIFLETYTVPAMLEDNPILDRVHQILERVDSVFSTGENSIKLLEANTYLRIIHSVEINGVLNTDAVENRLFRYNVTDIPYEFDQNIDLYLQRHRWTKDFPKGVFSWEFFDQGYPNYGADRDLVMATGLAELESVLRIATGTTLGSGNNTVRTITQQLVKVATPQPSPLPR